MKTFNKWLAGAMLLALSGSASVAAPTQQGHFPEKAFAVAMYPVSNACKLWLCLEKYNPNAKIQVELVNEQGQVLFREGLPAKGNKRNAFRQSFDVSQMSDGAYTLRISSATQTEQIAFKLSTPSVEQVPERLISLK